MPARTRTGNRAQHQAPARSRRVSSTVSGPARCRMAGCMSARTCRCSPGASGALRSTGLLPQGIGPGPKAGLVSSKHYVCCRCGYSLFYTSMPCIGFGGSKGRRISLDAVSASLGHSLRGAHGVWAPYCCTWPATGLDALSSFKIVTGSVAQGLNPAMPCRHTLRLRPATVPGRPTPDTPCGDSQVPGLKV